MNKHLKSVMLRGLVALAVCVAMIAGSTATSFATENLPPHRLDGAAEYQNLCNALDKIKGEKLSGKYCDKQYQKQSSQDNAVNAICGSKYKSKLKKQCNAYQTALSQAAASGSGSAGSYSLGSSNGPHSCGGPNQSIGTAIDFGCSHQGPAMLDLSFAVIRFLSNGAGLVIIGSLVWAGLQYIFSRGDPQSTASAVGRIRSTFVALLIFIFGYAILNYLIPGIVLQ